MPNPSRKRYIELKQEMAERKIIPIFFHAIDRKTGGAITRHGIPTTDGQFMYSDGTIDNLYHEKEIIHIKREDNVFRGRDNLFIRVKFPDGSAMLRYDDGTAFARIDQVRVMHTLYSGVHLESLKMVLPFDFIVTETYQDQGGIVVTLVGKDAYTKIHRLDFSKASSYDEVANPAKLVPYLNTWREDEKEAQMKWNINKGEDAHVRILKND